MATIARSLKHANDRNEWSFQF